jgi:hypothetical protein
VWLRDHRGWLRPSSPSCWDRGRLILMFDQVKNAPQLRVGLISEILSEGIFISVDHSRWEFFCWTTVLLLCWDVTLRRNTRWITFLEMTRFSPQKWFTLLFDAFRAAWRFRGFVPAVVSALLDCTQIIR